MDLMMTEKSTNQKIHNKNKMAIMSVIDGCSSNMICRRRVVMSWVLPTKLVMVMQVEDMHYVRCTMDGRLKDGWIQTRDESRRSREIWAVDDGGE
jgi:hypothetical protein